MNKRVISSIVLGLSLLVSGYYLYDNKSKAKIVEVDDHDDGPKTFPKDYSFEEGGSVSTGYVVKRGSININKDVKREKVEKREIVMIDGIPYEKFRGYLLPPEPDPEENKKGLLGVDVNNNYVRDDLEREFILDYKYQIRVGRVLQEIRAHTLLMLKKDVLPAGDMFMKIYALRPGSGPRTGLQKMIGNTEERRLALVSPGGGAYETIPSNDFTEFAYRDFSFSDSDDLSGYQWSMDFYENKPFPEFDKFGHLDAIYYNGESKMIRSRIKSCKLNYGTSNIKECYSLAKQRKENLTNIKNSNDYEKLNNEFNRIYKETINRYNEGSWNE